MNSAELNRHLARGRRLIERYARASSRSSEDTPIPDDPIEAYDKYVIWRHISTGELVRGVTPPQRRYIEQSSCWRHDADGARISGSDAIVKSRKMYFSSLILGLIAIEMCRVPGTRAVTMLQSGKDDLLRPMWTDMVDMMSRLPRGWCMIDSAIKGGSHAVYLTNGSSWKLMTAGSSVGVADRQIRSGTVHILHLSEAGIYAQYSTTIAAARTAVPERGGYLIAESTQSESPDHQYMEDVRLTMAGHGSYMTAQIHPWHTDEQRRVPRGTPRYERVMTPDFVAGMDDADLATERRLELSDEQIAWRRDTYLMGSARHRAAMRREYLEELGACYQYGVDTYIDSHALDMLDAMSRPAGITHAWSDEYRGEVWRGELDYALITADTTVRHGRDNTAVIMLDPYTRDVVGLCYGHATPSEIHASIWWLLEQAGCERRSRHMVSVERQRDDAVGLIDDHLMQDRRIRMWYGVHTRRDGTSVTAARPGHTLTHDRRERMIQILTEYLEGDPEVISGPQADVPSAIIAGEARDLRQDQETGRVAAPRGDTTHDDAIMALAAALWLQPKLHLPKRRGSAALGLPSSNKVKSRFRPR